MPTLRSLWPWGRGKPEPVVGQEAAEDRRRRLSLDRTYQTAQEQERGLRDAVERVQAELDVLRRER